jgi:hypothetical protein
MPKDGDLPQRDKELAGRRNSALHKELVETFGNVRRGFQDQGKRSDDILDYWDIYDCVLNHHNFYNGNSNIFVPIVYSAIEAIVTRFVNQIFPQSGRYIDATSTDLGVPHAMVALLEHYIRRAKLKTEVLPGLIRAGEVEGHYHLFVDWNRYERHVVSRETSGPKVGVPGLSAQIDSDDVVVDMVEELMVDEGPCLEVLLDADVLVQPVTAKSIDDALRQGGQVTIKRRWTKETLEKLIEDGEVMERPGRELLEMRRAFGEGGDNKDPYKDILDAAGIKEGGRFIQSHEMYKVLPTDEGDRLCSVIYGGGDLILSAKRIKWWNDRCPLLSAPQTKVAGSFKGAPRMGKGVDSLQYHANQVAQQGADSMTYSMLPIIMTDPAKNPRTSTMILNLAAIWEVDPNSTKFAEFPQLWQHAIQGVQSDMQMIFQAWGVNPSMLPQQTGRPGAKRNQAEIAMEIQVDLLTTAVGCSVLEEGIMTPAAEQMVDLDHQFRDDEVMIREFGEFGAAAKMERVPPQQNRQRLNFTWFGVEQARNAQQMQQQIAFLNVAKGMESALKQAGYILDPAPLLEHAAGNLFGWRMGRQVIRDIRQAMAMDPNQENAIMAEGMPVYVHPLDEDPKHIQSHMQAMQGLGDEHGLFRDHIQRHMAQMQMKAAAMMQQRGGGMPQPGGPPGGQPQPGSQPAGPKMLRGPNGAIHPDQMPAAGAVGAPRKT